MAEEISVYVDEKLHCALKTAAFNTLHGLDRKTMAASMDVIRESQEGYLLNEELLEMCKVGGAAD
ncbi:MAG: hypothetical protein U1E11_04325 [Dethiobacteria bacterium]|jgi:hypothetical protein|nr:hypothetical protein [Dethiobacteria bacterium]